MTANVLLWRDFRRIDVLLTVMGVFCVAGTGDRPAGAAHCLAACCAAAVLMIILPNLTVCNSIPPPRAAGVACGPLGGSTEWHRMSLLQAYLLGIMTTMVPSMLVMAWLIHVSPSLDDQ